MNYELYIKSEEWFRKRKLRIEIDGYRCRICDAKDDLSVHHRPNSYKKIPNESVVDDLTTLCQHCHDNGTDKIRSDRSKKKTIPSIEIKRELIIMGNGKSKERIILSQDINRDKINMDSGKNKERIIPSQEIKRQKITMEVI